MDYVIFTFNELHSISFSDIACNIVWYPWSSTSPRLFAGC